MNPGNETDRPGTHSEAEDRALRRMEELLTSKDNELAAKDEIIALLKEKLARLEHSSETAARPLSGNPRQEQASRAGNKRQEPKGTWEQLKDWFFNA